mgnify:CR=1 FL=1
MATDKASDTLFTKTTNRVTTVGYIDGHTQIILIIGRHMSLTMVIGRQS